MQLCLPLSAEYASASVGVVLASVVFVPSAPLLVPALSGPMAHDAEPIRTATLRAAAELAAASRSWVAIGAGDGSDTAIDETGLDETALDETAAGTFAPYGVDVPVTLHADVVPDAAPGSGTLPLSMLIAGWLREQVGGASVRPVVVDPAATPDECARIGAALAADLDADPGPIGVLVVGDGAISLSAKSPGGRLRPAAVELQAQLDTALGDGDLAALAALDPAACAAEGVSGRAAWQVAAALCEGRPMVAETCCAQAPFGVGYVVARWLPR